jgi:hypothetical protein
MQRRLGPIIMVLGFTLVGAGLFHGLATGNVKAELIALATGALLFYSGRAMADETK